uniref:Uncharacterized protein n=1 Tax=Neobodo designis TaxID=312471 RepID=A0A7S1QWU1_NEODS|mmetsp:Transcript_53366/g.164145  ORF Transcript_53366/g.164145 Transcript_53366/m.164145 type:complete len:213 (+) Transcript_53366:35-673(+)
MRVATALCVAALVVAAVVATGPARPNWPDQFDVPFGLNVAAADYVNRTSHFYYNWNLGAQRIKYHDGCLPLLTKKNCDLVFNSVGTFLMAPEAGIDCCLLFPGIGPTSPDALGEFNFTQTNVTAQDFYGKEHTCNEWDGAGFLYWTDVNSEMFVKFRDGPTGGIYWKFGDFHVAPQHITLFDVPSQCNSTCPVGAVGSQLALKSVLPVIRRH